MTGVYSMLIKVAFPSTQELDQFIGRLQHFGNTSTQIVFSTPVPHRDVIITEEPPEEFIKIWFFVGWYSWVGKK